MAKIMYILKSFAMAAGTERVMSDKMNYLAEHGYDITLVTYEQGTHPFAYPLHHSIRHIDLNTRLFVLEISFFIKYILLVWVLRRKFRLLLQSLLDEVEPDIIITTTYSKKFLDIILSVRTHAYRIVESHVACNALQKSIEYGSNSIVRFILSKYDNWILGKVAKADLFITLTKGDAAEWQAYTSNIQVIPNPVTYYPDEVKSHDGTGRTIICAGRLENQKGFDLLIDAFALVASQCPEWKLDIYGDGSDKPLLMNKIIQYGLGPRITILPSSSAIYQEYQNSEFCVMSSRYEGFGLVLVEAMSCGIPCVSFKCKYGPEDIIKDGEDGLLVENGNVKDLSDKILWMINNTEQRLQMGRKARENVRRYHKDVIMSQWLLLFRKIEEKLQNTNTNQLL